MIERTLELFRRYRWALLSGLMMGTSYVPCPPWALAFCFVPLWWDLFFNTQTAKEAFAKGWWAQFLLTFLGFHWVAYVAEVFASFPKPLAWATLGLFSAVAHLYIPVAAVIGHWLKNKCSWNLWIYVTAMACLQNLGEAFWPSIFNWNLGYPLLYWELPWSQWADTIGFLGLSFGLLLLSAFFTWLLDNWEMPKAWGLAAVILIFLCWTGQAGRERGRLWQDISVQRLKASLIQANIGNVEKIFEEKGSSYPAHILEKLDSLSLAALQIDPDIELLVWPEIAVPIFLDAHNRNGKYAQLFFSDLNDRGRDLITGGYSSDPPGSDARKVYNAIFCFGADGQPLDEPYHKTNLLIIGEYVPLGQVFPILKKWNPGGPGFGAGSGPKVIQWRSSKIGLQICYDSLDPHFSRSLALMGADLLINVTNDSWFGPVFEPEQHMSMTLARALEVRRPLLRSTNTGISTAIEASGKILQRSALGTEGFTTLELHYAENAPQTFYAQAGGFLAYFPLVILLVLLVSSRPGMRPRVSQRAGQYHRPGLIRRQFSSIDT